MGSFDSTSPCELIIISALSALLISDDRDSGELNVLGNFVVSIGGLILTWAAQMQLLESSQSTDNSKEDTTMEEIKAQIKSLQDKCEELERTCAKQKAESFH